MKWLQHKAKSKYKVDDLIVDKIASIRGIKDINEWINPSSKHVHSPYELDNIDEAVQRIVKAIHTGEKIQIIADIDTDGVCSTGIMFNYLKGLTTENNISYVHGQRSWGHGVEKVIDKIDDDTNLVIIVDSSSNSVEGCKTLKESGKDIIVIDHHEIDVENPYITLVNCQQGDYRNKHLSGSSMVFKVCQVLDEYLDLEWADDFLDLSAIGLVGDMMSVRNMENRYLIYNGINAINNIGIKQILGQSKVDYSEGITTTNISFKVAPIIGACSRFDKIELALELVSTDDEDRAKELAKEMIKLNERRKTEQKEIVDKVVNAIDTSNNIVIIVNNDIDSGFRGLIATEVVERYSKPVFVLSEIYDENSNVIKFGGSARSVGLIPLKDMCNDSGLFNFARGHLMAHGVEFNADKMGEIISYFNDTLDKEDLQKVVEYDLEIDASDIDDLDIKQIESFSRICGQGFTEPKFKITGVIIEEGHTKKLGTHVRAVMGANLDTVKIHAENNFALMKFRSNDQYGSDIEQHYYGDSFMTELTVVGSLNMNVFFNWSTRTNEITKQIFIEDYKIME